MADALRRQEELRRSLVADVAHELRTPVTILRAECEEMVDGLAAPTPERLSSLHDEVLRLGRVVEDLEALNTAEAAALRLEHLPVDLASVAGEAVDLLRARFDDADLQFETHLTPLTVGGDATRLHQIVVNLLTNALKFTPARGTVTVTVEPASAVTSQPTWAMKAVITKPATGSAQRYPRATPTRPTNAPAEERASSQE